MQGARSLHCLRPATVLPLSTCPPSCPASSPSRASPASPEKCGEEVLSADGSLASTALPQASLARISARVPLPLPRPHGLGQTSASRPPSFDQYRASSQGGCRLHPPRRPQLSPGPMGEGAAAWLRDSGGGVGQVRVGKAGITHRVIHSFTHSLLCPQMFNPQIFSEYQLCTRHCHQLWGQCEDKTAALVEMSVLMWKTMNKNKKFQNVIKIKYHRVTERLGQHSSR